MIVPVRNEAAAIEQTLTTLLEQDYPTDRFEVIVADGFSEDETVTIVRRLQLRYHNLKLAYNPGRLASAGRNAGICRATGDVCVIIDGHCTIPDDQHIRKIATAFERSGAACLGRPQPLQIDDATPFQRAVWMARRSRLGHNPDSAIYSDQAGPVRAENVAVAYRRDVFEQVGLFDERFDACEDVEFNTRVDRAGLRCHFAPETVVHYHPRTNLTGLFRQMARYGRGRCRLAFKHPGSLTMPALVPAAWLVWLVVAPLLGLLWWPMTMIWVGSMLLYAGVIGATSLRMAGSRVDQVVRLATIFAAIHGGFGWGFLKELATRMVILVRSTGIAR